MSRENVDLIRAVFRGWDEARVDGMLPFLHEDVEYRPMEEAGSINGHGALRRYFERWMEAWDEFEVRPTEFLHNGDRVFNGVAMRASGRGSGVEVAREGFQVWHFRDGMGARIEEYVDRAEALEAVGLSE